MQAEVAIVSGLGLFVDEAHVVGTCHDAVLAADTPGRIHRHDARLGIVMSGAGRAHLCAGGILALLARNADVTAIGLVTAVGFELAALQLQQQTRAALGQLVGLVTGISAVSATDALVLVKDHHIVRAAAAVGRGRSRRPGKRRQKQRAGSGTCEEFSPVNLIAHDILHRQNRLAWANVSAD